MLECVVNISEGSNRDTIDDIAAAAGTDLLDVHTDAHHNRSVLTLMGEVAPRAVAAAAVRLLDIGVHAGVHPRIGVVDVVPFVPLDDSTDADAIEARDAFCTWAGSELQVPCFRYGPERSLPDIRRGAFGDLAPDCGPLQPHPTAGAMAVGARPILVAYNVWLAGADLAEARSIASEIRSSTVRALGLQVGDDVQVSMNLIAPQVTGPGDVVDRIGERARINRCELVGLVPQSVLDREPPDRWAELDLAPDRTIEGAAEALKVLRQ